MTANEALAADAVSKKSTPAVKEAECFLRQLLAAGPLPSRQVKSEAEEFGLNLATLRRAKTKLGIKPYKDGMKGGWVCALPKALKLSEHAQLKDVSTFGPDEHLRAPTQPLEVPDKAEMPEGRG